MPTIDISDRIERRVGDFSEDQAAGAIKIQAAQRVLENGRTTTQLLSYPADGGEPTGYVVTDAWHTLSGLPLDRCDGYLLENDDGAFLFARRMVQVVPAEKLTMLEALDSLIAPAPEEEEPTEENTAPESADAAPEHDEPHPPHEHEDDSEHAGS